MMIIALGLMMIFVQSLQGQDTLALAQQAAASYDSGDYVAAREQYELLIDLGVHDSAIYINLGNTCYQMEDRGGALLNYRRAQALAPRDNQLNANLARVRSLRTDVQGDETALVDSLAALTITVMTGNELHGFILGLWSLFFGLLLTAIVRAGWRELLRGPLVVAGIVLLFGLALWLSRLYTDQYRPVAVILEDVVQVMSGPDDDYLPLYELHAAAELRILERRDGWIRFILPDQQQGWIKSAVIEEV